MTPSEPAKKDAPTYVSLRARTEAVKQQLKATGHYKAIDDLRLKERDVIRFELLYSRLQSIVIGSQLVGSKVACSPGTREVGESVVGLYTP